MRPNTTSFLVLLAAAFLLFAGACENDDGNERPNNPYPSGDGDSDSDGDSDGDSDADADSDSDTGTGGSTGAAVAKFCNTLSGGGADVTLLVRIGTGLDEVVLSALTLNCSTGMGAACTPIPAGLQTPVNLEEQSGTVLASFFADISAGEEWFFVTDLDPVTSQPTLLGGSLKPEFDCSTTNHETN